MPVVTILIILVNVIVFMLELMGGEAFVMRWSVIPADIVAGQRLITILTGMFMHAGWSHIIGNMIYLWAFGPAIEDSMGPGRHLVFYLTGGLGATLAQVAGNPLSTIPNLGASGAIAAVMGAFLVTYPHDRIRTVLIIFVFCADSLRSSCAPDRRVVPCPALQRWDSGTSGDRRSGIPGACGRVHLGSGRGPPVRTTTRNELLTAFTRLLPATSASLRRAPAPASTPRA